MRIKTPNSRLKSLLLKEYLLLLRRKKFIIMVLSLPVIFAILYQASSTMQPGITISVGVCNLDDSEQSANLVSEMGDYFQVTEYPLPCQDNLARGVRDNSIFLGIMIPADFFDKLSSFNKSDIYIYYDNSNPILSNYLDFFFQLSLKNYENALLRQAGDSIKFEAQKANIIVTSAYTVLDSIRFLGYGIPSVADQVLEIKGALERIQALDISFVTEPVVVNKVGAYNLKNESGIGAAMIFAILSLFTALLLVSSNMLFDKENNFIIRLKVSKTSSITYLLSKVLFFDFVLLAQYLVVFPLFLSVTWLNVSIIALLLTLLIVASINVLMGVLVGLLSENQAMAVLTSLLLTLPFLFLSGMFYPSELFPPPLKFVSDVFPLSNEIILMKQSMAFGYDISLNSSSVQINLLYLVSFFVASWFLLRFRQR
jgi:ABC-type multidrug transport system permease subunit